MLLIATPKSASTGFLRGIAASLGIQHFMGSEFFSRSYIFGLKKSEGYHVCLSNHLTDFFECNTDIIHTFNNPLQIHKHHLAPSPNNIESLAHIKKIILIRDSKQLAASYFREAQNSKSYRPLFHGCTTLTDFENVFNSSGMLSEINNFNDGWIADKNASNLVFEYEELVRCSKANKFDLIIKKIENFFGVSSVTILKSMPKHKYYRAKLLKNFFKGL